MSWYGSTAQRTALVMRRGDVWIVDFNPVRGSEANKIRPAVLVSNDRANATAARLGYGVVTVIPVTSNVTNVYPFQVLLPVGITGLLSASKAQAEQVRSVAVERLTRFLGRVTTDDLTGIDNALRLHLDL